MSEHCYKFPPDLTQHLRNTKCNIYDDGEQDGQEKRPPYVFIVFMSVGSVFVLYQLFNVVPLVLKLRRAGEILRSERNGVMYPSILRTDMVIVSMPMVISIMQFLTLIDPLYTFQCTFFQSCYQSLALYLFSRSITNHNNQLGSIDALWLAMRRVRSHFFTAKPLCCFFHCCKEDSICARKCGCGINHCKCGFNIANRKVTKKDLRLIDTLIVQFPVLMPIIGFLTFQREVAYAKGSNITTQLFTVSSTMACMTALNALSTLVTDFADLEEGHRLEDYLDCTPDGSDPSLKKNDSSEPYGQSQEITTLEVNNKGESKATMKKQSANEQGSQPLLQSVDGGSLSNRDDSTVSAAQKMRAMAQVLMCTKIPTSIIKLIGVDGLSGSRGKVYTPKVMTQAYDAFLVIVLITIPLRQLVELYNLDRCVAEARRSYRIHLGRSHTVAKLPIE